MSEYKKVKIEKLEEFRCLLLTEKSRKKLLAYFDNYILEAEKQDINNLKRMIYSTMQQCKQINENKYRDYYILYQNLKKGFISYKAALDMFMAM